MADFWLLTEPLFWFLHIVFHINMSFNCYQSWLPMPYHTHNIISSVCSVLWYKWSGCPLGFTSPLLGVFSRVTLGFYPSPIPTDPVLSPSAPQGCYYFRPQPSSVHSRKNLFYFPFLWQGMHPHFEPFLFLSLSGSVDGHLAWGIISESLILTSSFSNPHGLGEYKDGIKSQCSLFC